MVLTYILIWGSWVVFGATTALGLAWAIRHGQLSNASAAARSIFDAEEPVGLETDRFVDLEHRDEGVRWTS